MADSYLRRVPVDILNPSHAGARRSADQIPMEVSYVCAVCGSPWQYQEVRNTGLCPACGSGLQRSPDP